MLEWKEFIEALSTCETSDKFVVLMNSIGEKLVISEDSKEYSGHEKFKYYKFLRQGIGLIFINNNLKRIHLYLTNNQPNYSPYISELPSGIDLSYDKNKIISLLGNPIK